MGGTADGAGHLVVDWVYELALNPERYEEMIARWEEATSRIGRGEAQTGFFDDAAIQRHFARAEQLLDRLADESPQNECVALLGAFDSAAAVVIDAQGRLRAANQAARAAFNLGAQAGEVSDFGLELEDERALRRILRARLAPQEAAGSVFRFRSAEHGRFVLFHFRRHELRDGVPVLLAVTSEVVWPPGFSELLRDAFELTPAEADIVRLLVECASLPKIAKLRGRSVETIRAQLRAVLQKTETHSQSELVRLALSMMDIAAHTLACEPAAAAAASAQAAQADAGWRSLTRPDGRRVAYRLLGDPQGAPLLYLMHDYGIADWPAPACDAARRLGLKAIAPLRPGLLGTDRPLKGADPIATHLEDCRAALDAEGAGRVAVLAAGVTCLAFPLIAATPARFTGLIAAPGYLPFDRPEQYERMGKWHRLIQSSARYAPRTLGFMVKAGFHLARRIGKDGFCRAVYSDSAADMALFDIAETRRAILEGSEIALGPQVVADRALTEIVAHAARGAWGREARAVARALPVRFFNGLDDPECPEATFREQADSFPEITFKADPQAGYFIFFQNPDPVLTAVAALTPASAGPQ